MNMGELAKGVAATIGSSEAETKAAITAVFDQIVGAAAKGEEVSIPGLGKFAVKDRPERRTQPSDRRGDDDRSIEKVSFTAAKGLKDKL